MQNLVMAKSHCTRTCIKSSKEYCVLCVKNNACKRISIDREVARQVSSIIDVDGCSCRGSVEGRINKRLKRSQSIHQVSRSYRGDRSFLDRSIRCREAVKIAIRKSLEARQIAKCREGVEEVSSKFLKSVF